jgi:ATP-binding cassette, subfamily B, bacterial MsbA
VMDHGEIVESGSHQALFNKNGYYTKLYQKEFE